MPTTFCRICAGICGLQVDATREVGARLAAEHGQPKIASPRQASTHGASPRRITGEGFKDQDACD